MTLLAFRAADGSRTFTCTGCESVVYQAVDVGEILPICELRKWLDDRPDIPKETRDRLRHRRTA